MALCQLFSDALRNCFNNWHINNWHKLAEYTHINQCA